MTIVNAKRRIFGRTSVPFERIALGVLGPLLVVAHVVLALATLALVCALSIPLL